MKRERSELTAQGVAAILTPHVSKPLWIQYRLTAGKARPVEIARLSPLLRDLRAEQENLSFKQSLIVAAVRTVVDDCTWKGFEDSGAKAEWAVSTASRPAETSCKAC